MFDPDRDDDSGMRRFYRRILVIAAVAAVAAGIVWPAIAGFSGGPDGEKACVAVFDGWASSHSDPGESAPNDQQEAYMEWHDSHPCVDEARHRLIWSAALLAVLGGCVGAAVARGEKRDDRRDTALPVGGTTSG